MLYLLDNTAPCTPFPDVENAEHEPDGLLAVGGDLSPVRLINAYGQGIFPWYSQEQPILWWSPDPRLVLYPQDIHVSRSLNKTLRRGLFSTSMDRAFEQVVRACSSPRAGDPGTWLVEDMIQAYLRLHDRHQAHSVEVWCEGELTGGLYGVAIGRVFFGESMFSRRTDASKVALVHLARTLEQWGYRLIDCQIRTEHLVSLGAQEIPRREFIRQLQACKDLPGKAGSWNLPGAG